MGVERLKTDSLGSGDFRQPLNIQDSGLLVRPQSNNSLTDSSRVEHGCSVRMFDETWHYH